MFGNNVKVLLQDMDLIKWKQDLLADKDKLETILLEAINVTPDRDAKLIELRTLIENKIRNFINYDNRKVVIFTAFADTAKYLYKHLSEEFANKGIYSAIVTGSGDNHSTLPIPKELRRSVKMTDINTVLTLFSPISKECSKVYPEVNEYIDILIATDCISEGQNLQDCDYLVNYDIHWNPVRIIQRFGRIDRIGSKNDSITMVNYWPDVTLDSYINLKQRVESKMLISNMASTGDDNILNLDEKDLDYRKVQLQRLQDEVIDLEDLRDGVSITDLGLNDFRIDLSNFIKNYGELKNIPEGVRAVAQSNQTFAPGVIFVLKNIHTSVNIAKLNRLHPS